MAKRLPLERMEWHHAVQYMLESPQNVVTPINFGIDWAGRANHRKLMRIYDGQLQYRYGFWDAGNWTSAVQAETIRPTANSKFPLFRPAVPEECGKIEFDVEVESGVVEEITAGLAPEMRQVVAAVLEVIGATRQS